MKLSNRSKYLSIRLNSLLLIGVFTLVATVVAVPFYSVGLSSSSALESRRDLNERSPIKPAQVLSATISSGISLPLFLPQATPTPSVSTFDGTGGTCGAAKVEFNLGDQVCATVTNTGGAASRRRITWQDPDGFVRQSTAISSDPQSDNFTIPATPTSTLSNGEVVHNLGNWRVNLVGRSLVTYAAFVVKDPANPTADLSVTKVAPSNSQQVAAGANGSFDIYVQNSGPDNAATVSVVDHVPDNTTFVSLLQTAGQTNAEFSCTTVPDGNGNVTCSINTFTAGTFASFQFIYTVNTGTAAGTAITNTVSIASATTNELNNADNSATASASVSGTPSTGTCSVGCPDDITTPANTVDQNNQPGAIVHFSPPTGNMECGVIVVDHCNDCFFPQGTTVVTATGTGDSCSFAVTVTPSGSSPTISCPANQTGTADNDCSASISVGTATATGTNVTVVGFRSDGKPMYTCDDFGNCTRNSSDAPFSAGTTTITWYAYAHDLAGPYNAQTGNEESHRSGSATCTQTVVVNDVTPPVIAATDSTASADGNCQAPVPDYSNTVSDNCACASSDTSDACAGHPHITYTQTPAAGTLVGLGAHTVHIEANDGSSNNNGAGNTSTKDVTFTVNDTTAPIITCPGNITTSNDPGSCSATVNPGTATATDNCDSTPTITGTRSDNQSLNAPYPKGTTTITWTAKDDANNSSSCTQTVTVNDTENPTISCPGNITRNNDPGVCGAVVTYTTPVGSDNCPGATTAQTAGLPSGSTFPVGTTTNTFEVTDTSGNKTSCSFTVTVNDVENPVISCPSSQTLEPTCPSGAVANWTPPVGTDNCPGAVTTRTAGPAPGSVFPVGTTTVTYTVNDAHGNSASCSFTVTVKTVFQTIEDLKAAVNSSSLNGSQKQGLISKLQAAEDALAIGHTSTACQKLADFINSVQNYIAHGNISAATGNAWISTAAHVRNALGCTSNPCT